MNNLSQFWSRLREDVWEWTRMVRGAIPEKAPRF